MRTWFLLAAFVLAGIATALRAQSPVRDELFFDALAFRGATPDSARVDLIVAVPYSLLDFERRGGINTARYQLRLRVTGPSGTWYDSVFSRTITTPSFETSSGSQPAYEFYQQSITLPPGSYDTHAEVVDLIANRVATADESLMVAGGADRDFATSDLMLVSRIREDSSGFVIAPMLTKNVNANDGGYFLFFEVYNATDDSLVAVRGTFRTKERGDVYEALRAEKRIPRGRSQQWVHLSDSGLARGTYTLRLEFHPAGDTGRLLASAERSISTSGTLEGAPNSAEELDERLSQLRYAASQSEIERIRGAGTLNEQRRQYAEFWRRLDPTPGTVENEAMDEYFRRIDYADRSFRSYAAGWLTDKGRVYVIYGPPDNTSSDPFRNDGKAVETWQYYRRNLRVVFVDESGFGDFRLLTHLPPGEKYRYGD